MWGYLVISADLRCPHGMVETGWSHGAVALVLEGFEMGTHPKPMLQRRRTTLFGPYRADGEGRCGRVGVARASWGELGRAGPS